MSDTVTLEQVQKSLEALQNIAKGHGSKGTNTTKVESMSGQGGSTQVYHTPSNSDPGSWAGSVSRDVPENGASDAIDANGTDYNGGAQMVKSVLDKVAKGLPLTAVEFAVLKSVTEKAMKNDKDEDDVAKAANDKDDKDVAKAKSSDDKPDDEDDKNLPFGKSVSQALASDPQVEKGFEVSDFLENWSNTICKSIENLEARISRRIDAKFAQLDSEQGAFQKSLANAISSVGNTVVLTAQRMDQVESLPAGGFKSVPGAIAKSGPYTGENPGEDLISKALGGDYASKNLVGDILADLVVKGQAQPIDVVRFNTTGELSPLLRKKVSAHSVEL